MGILLSLLMLGGMTSSAIGLIFYLFPSATAPSKNNTFVKAAVPHPPYGQEEFSHPEETIIV